MFSNSSKSYHLYENIGRLLWTQKKSENLSTYVCFQFSLPSNIQSLRIKIPSSSLSLLLSHILKIDLSFLFHWNFIFSDKVHLLWSRMICQGYIGDFAAHYKSPICRDNCITRRCITILIKLVWICQASDENSSVESEYNLCCTVSKGKDTNAHTAKINFCITLKLNFRLHVCGQTGWT